MVEWKKLGEVAHYYRGVTYNKQQEVSLNSGGTRILRANNINIGINTLNYDDVKEISKEVKIKNYQWLYKEDILICAGSGSKEHVGKVAYIKEDLDYAYGGFMGKIVTDNSLIPRYLFHIISGLMFKKYLEVALNSTTINNLNSDIIYNFEIPVPSLSEQTRIVGILDTFTASIENLKEQIAQRRKQYEYYRDQLLDLEGKPGVEMKTLGEIGRCVAGATPSTKVPEYWEGGNIPWMSSGEVHQKNVTHTTNFITKKGYENASTKMLPVGTIVIALAGQGKTRGSVAITAIELCTNQSLCGVIISDVKIVNKFIYYYMSTRYDDLRRISSGDGTRGGLNLKMISSYLVPISPLSEQQRIVSILDSFEASVANLEEQLALREKQYEYYRNKLLTFE